MRRHHHGASAGPFVTVMLVTLLAWGTYAFFSETDYLLTVIENAQKVATMIAPLRGAW